MLQYLARWNRWYDDLDKTHPFLRFFIIAIPWFGIVLWMNTAVQTGQKGVFIALLAFTMVALLMRVAWINGWLKLKSK